jgi:SAM-dependent methyltransferase
VAELVELAPDRSEHGRVVDLASVLTPPAEQHAMRRVTREVAFEGAWTSGRAHKVEELFDSMAAGWDAPRSEAVRVAPIHDAVARGGLAPGRWLELGAGTGIGTRILAPALDSVVAFDMAMRMLTAMPQVVAPRVRGDASCLPFGDGTFAGVAMVNMLLFPSEVDRVVGERGQVLWVNTSGASTPIHLTPEELLSALPGSWRCRWACSGKGFWVVAERSA